ncbi:MAG: SH3 domain-containing protein [Azonexaceae bacterium]|nr:SH3 domain-containing protein [Azonexaceae bacterium]
MTTLSKNLQHWLLPLLLSLTSLAHAQNSGALIRAADLKAEPFVDAASIATLPGDSIVTVVDGKGGWSKVKTKDGKTGWVRMLNVRVASITPESSTLDQIGNVMRTGTTKGTATTGVKGLSQEDIARSVPSPAEVKKLEAYRASDIDIHKFAATRKLTARNLPELKP